MSISIPQFITIKDFSQFQFQSLETQAQQILFKGKNHDDTETMDNQNSDLEPSLKKKSNIMDQELSFERNFRQQHIETFDFFAQNYLESVFEDAPLKVDNFLNQTIFFQKSIFADDPHQIQYYLGSNECPLEPEKTKIFMENLTNWEKFHEFLQYVCSKCCDKVAFEMLMIAHDVWGQCLVIEKYQFSYETLVEYCKNLMEQSWQAIKQRKILQFINFNKTGLKPSLNIEKKIQEQRKFLQFLIVTFFLVAFEYFDNPYYEEKIQQQLKSHIFYNNPSFMNEYDSFSDSQDDSQPEMFLRTKNKRK